MQVEHVRIEMKDAGSKGSNGHSSGSATNRSDGSNGHPTRKQRVLLTNAYGPYELKWGTAPSDLLGARLARGHEMLAMGSRLPTWALYLIAENLTNPCTVLEYPRWDDFVRELGEGYDVVAIELKSIHTRRVVQMMKAIREHSPGTRIVIGGYGVGALRDGMPGDTEELAKHILEDADLICRGEGVRTMRQYLGDAPYDRPITQYHLPPATVRPYQGEARLEIRLPSILVSLGCPSACDFCNTSAFFHHKKTYMASPAQVYDFMKNYQRRLGEDRITFILFDEDIFLDAEYVRELGRLIRSDPKTWGFRWISFGSVKALEQFTPRELRECGVEGIWIGVESGLVDHGTEKLGYSKRGAQDPVALFEQLRNHGIQTIGSMILGLDFHTPDNIEQDIDYFVSLKPTFYQIGPIRPCPGTKLYRQMRKQGRITQDYDWEHFHLWEETSHKPKHFEQGGIRKYYDLAHERLKTVLGSPVLQIYEANLLAYETFKDADTAFLRYQAEVSLDSVRRLHPVVRGLEVNPESPAVLRRTRALIARAEPHLHQDGLAARVFRRVAGRVVGWRMSVPSEAATPAGLYAPDTAWARYDDDGSGGPRVKTASAAPPRPLDEVERGERARRTNVARRVRSLVVGSETSI